jgi:hypothetical protein
MKKKINKETEVDIDKPVHILKFYECSSCGFNRVRIDDVECNWCGRIIKWVADEVD